MPTFLLYGLLPVVSTFIGGYVVLRWKRDLHPWMSLSGGILLGVAFLDLLPEAFEHGPEHGLTTVTIGGAALAAILAFYLLDALLGAHHHDHEDHGHVEAAHNEICHNERHLERKSWIRASGIILHTFIDGIAIGAGFAANEALGILILTAVVLHDFSDGMSTVTILKAIKQNEKGIFMMLIVNAIAPFIGVIVGWRLAISEAIIAVLLAVFSGFFITLALSELLPQAHAASSRRSSLTLTVLGICFVVGLRLLGHH